MEHFKIINREDGSIVKIDVCLTVDKDTQPTWRQAIWFKAKNEATFTRKVPTEHYPSVVEITQAKLEMWHKLNPSNTPLSGFSPGGVQTCGVKKPDNVNHPAHYTDGKIEVIDFIEDKKLGMHLGNAVKYISRAGKKDPAKTAEDLKKAVWYVERFISLLEKNN